MEEAKLHEIMELKDSSLEDLRAKYEELFDGQKPTSNNKAFIWRKLAYKMQELAYGGLSEATKGRINELIKLYDPVNNKSLRPGEPVPKIGKKRGISHDRRLPIPGTIITKEYKGRSLAIKVLEGNFEFNGKIYKSLTAIAKEVTGAHWNGYLFFNL